MSEAPLELLRRAELHVAAKEPAEARALLERAIELAPSDAELWNALGNALAMGGSAGDAESAYRRSIELEPTLQKPLANLGNLKLRAGDAAGAIELYHRAVPLAPENARVWKNLGAALSMSGRLAEAIEALQRSIVTAPVATTFEALASAFATLGDEEASAQASALGRAAEIAAKPGGVLSIADVERKDFWGSIAPMLTVEGEGTETALSSLDLGTVMQNLRYEGYVNVPGVVPQARVAALRAGVEALVARGIPPLFTLVYDQIWSLFEDLAPFLEAVLGKGYVGLPAYWVWHVDARDAAAGWGPHRDRSTRTIDDDNTPHCITVWMPLSDATPLNGCIYVLPAHHDERFSRRDWSGDDNNKVFEPQKIRALPATAGSLLSWNHALLHWGGQASRMAKGPRISAAFEFQRGDIQRIESPVLRPDRRPTFHERLGLIGKQILRYRHMYPLSEELAAIATLLEARFEIRDDRA